MNSAEDRLNASALALTTGLLLAFAVAFFLYYGLNTMNDPVFSIDFAPYHLAGRLLAQGDLEPLTNYAETGGFFATSGPFLDYFHQFFFPQSTYATRPVYLPAYLWIFRPLAGFDFPTASRIWLTVNALLTLACFWLLWSARRLSALSGQLKNWRMAWFAFLVLTFQPMLSNLWHGQVTGLIFACFCLSYWLLHRNRPLAAGLALGLIIPFKFYTEREIITVITPLEMADPGMPGPFFIGHKTDNPPLTFDIIVGRNLKTGNFRKVWVIFRVKGVGEKVNYPPRTEFAWR